MRHPCRYLMSKRQNLRQTFVLLAAVLAINFIWLQHSVHDAAASLELPPSASLHAAVSPAINKTCSSIENNNKTVVFRHSITGWKNLQELLLPRMTPICTLLSEHLSNNTQNDDCSSSRFVLNVTIPCQKLFKSSYLGTGNWMFLLYSAYAAFQSVPHADFYFACHDHDTTRHNLVLPWVLATPTAVNSSFQFSEFCRPKGGKAKEYRKQPFDRMLPVIRRDLRRMASQETSRSKTNPYYNDAVIHFRCGDLLTNGHAGYEFLKFHDLIRPFVNSTTIQSIGIVTQPLGEKHVQTRYMDKVEISGARCRRVLDALIEYLQARFPNTTAVQVHNGPRETVVTSMLRMMTARYLTAAHSSFSVMAAAAAYGTVYVPHPKNGWTQWITAVADPRIHILEPVHDTLNSAIASAVWNFPGGAAEVVAWFRNDTCLLEYCSPEFADTRRRIHNETAAL